MSKNIIGFFALVTCLSTLAGCELFNDQEFGTAEQTAVAGASGSSSTSDDESEGGSDAVAGASSDDESEGGSAGATSDDESEGGSAGTTSDDESEGESAGTTSEDEGVGGKSSNGSGGRSTTSGTGGKSSNGVGGATSDDESEGGSAGITSDDESEGGSDAVGGSSSEDEPVDADGDGETADTDCNDSNSSISHNLAEVCDDGLDNDCDAIQDCDDPDCTDDPACTNSEIEATTVTYVVQFLIGDLVDVWSSHRMHFRISGQPVEDTQLVSCTRMASEEVGVECFMSVNQALSWNFGYCSDTNCQGHFPILVDGYCSTARAGIRVSRLTESGRETIPFVMLSDAGGCALSIPAGGIVTLSEDTDGDSVVDSDDCDPLNPSVHPPLNASDGEVLGNLLDEDCSGAIDDDDEGDLGSGTTSPATLRTEVHTFFPKDVGGSFDFVSSSSLSLTEFLPESQMTACSVVTAMDPGSGLDVQAIRCTVERDSVEEYVFSGRVGTEYLTGWDCVEGTDCAQHYAVASFRDYVTVSGYKYAYVGDVSGGYPCQADLRMSDDGGTAYAVLASIAECDNSNVSSSVYVGSATTGSRVEVHNFIPNDLGASFSTSDALLTEIEPVSSTWPCTSTSIQDPVTGSYVQGIRCLVTRDVSVPFVYGARVGSTYLSGWDCVEGTSCTRVNVHSFRDYVTVNGLPFAALDDNQTEYPYTIGLQYRSDVDSVYAVVPVP